MTPTHLQYLLDYMGLTERTIRFIRDGESVPYYWADTVDEETQPLVEPLIAMNQAGFLTDNSQPGSAEMQRAYVSGFLPQDTFEEIFTTISKMSTLIALTAVPGSLQLESYGVTVTLDQGQPFSFVRPGSSLYAMWGRELGKSHAVAIEESLSLVSVVFFDPEYGRVRKLFDDLAEILTL